MDSYINRRDMVEDLLIGPYGVKSRDSRGRMRPDDESPSRTCFQRDVDRIIHSKAFRRLKHKTQVFLRPEGDHYRTRLTHTLEVTRIARTIARALGLNEDLTEAIGLGHDLGHTPFGHAGERALAVIMGDMGGFYHYEQSLRVVDRLEKDGEGLNLTYEVRDGILRHTCDPLAATLEGQIVRLADKLAYVNHDVDDAIRAGVITDDDIPAVVKQVIGTRHSQRVNTMTEDVINNSMDTGIITMSDEMAAAQDVFVEFLYEYVYRNPVAKSEESKVLGMMDVLFEYYIKHPDQLPCEYLMISAQDGLERAVCDYISGMTDRYAAVCLENIFIPAAWGKL